MSLKGPGSEGKCKSGSSRSTRFSAHESWTHCSEAHYYCRCGTLPYLPLGQQEYAFLFLSDELRVVLCAHKVGTALPVGVREVPLCSSPSEQSRASLKSSRKKKRKQSATIATTMRLKMAEWPTL